ncbi:hypothetical protein ABW19_dt0201001 [Dactylella cylindrospora]|nr:hypothetical protein ABW19_dt0201001 [Dactylella cylindrospora]
MALAQGAKPLRIHKETTQLLRTGILKKEPLWYRVVSAIPPSTILVRTTPVDFALPNDHSTTILPPKKIKKSKRFFQPGHIHYPEDALRKKFFADHPWELARPRVLVENGGNDSLRYDWSRIQQPGKALDGESVVQRQMWLMENRSLSQKDAYDVARREFYRLRMREDVQRRIAIEEAKSVGAYFGKTYIQVGLELEEQALSAWRLRAQEELTKRQQRIEMASGQSSLEDTVGDEDLSTPNSTDEATGKGEQE